MKVTVTPVTENIKRHKTDNINLLLKFITQIPFFLIEKGNTSLENEEKTQSSKQSFPGGKIGMNFQTAQA